jgi:glucose-fructose oxidoreductase
VVGLGHISQVAVLPAFDHAGRNSVLAALVSGDPVKRRKLGRRHGVPGYGYDEYDRLLASGEIDAVYIGLPNSLHCEYTVKAARAGVHVLCEKPMAVTARECQRMIRAAERHRVQLMIAYRLHFEAANLAALQIARSGRIGELRLFESTFTMQVRPGNVRLVASEFGGGPLFDIGIYCLQAARLLFGAEPTEVQAMGARGDDARFREIDEATSAVLRFPGERLATFTVSFGAADVSAYRLVGTRGDLRVEPAYEYHGELVHHLTIGGRTRQRRFAKHDQFAPELLHFSECVLRGKQPEPSGIEGSIDVQVIQALERSARSGRRIELPEFPREQPPTPRQERRLPAVSRRKLVRAASASH